MTIKYKIEEQDFLNFQLFTASKSDRINKKKRNGQIYLTLGSGLLALFFYFNLNISMSIYFGIVALVSWLFYPKYFRWRYKKHYHAYIKENYSKRFGQVETLEFAKDSIYSKSKVGEGKINSSEIETINETGNHFFIKISTGVSLIIPKRALDNIAELRNTFKEIGLNIEDETK